MVIDDGGVMMAMVATVENVKWFLTVPSTCFFSDSLMQSVCCLCVYKEETGDFDVAQGSLDITVLLPHPPRGLRL